MAQLNIHRVNALPVALEANSLYIVRRSEYALVELVFTTRDAEILKSIDTETVQTMIAAKLAEVASIKIVNDIVERDQLAFTADASVFVRDAGDDPLVEDGSALYFYKHDTQEYELVISTKKPNWGDIIDRPVSTVEDIDNAVDLKHSHANTDILDSLVDIDGELIYKGTVINNVTFISSEW